MSGGKFFHFCMGGIGQADSFLYQADTDHGRAQDN